MTSQLNSVKPNKPGFISWTEFLQVMQSVSVGHQKRLSQQLNSADLEHGYVDCGLSRFMMAEVSTFARAINQILRKEPALRDRLPIDPTNDDLFDTFSDGLVLAYLLKAIDPTLIEMKKLSHSRKMNVF